MIDGLSQLEMNWRSALLAVLMLCTLVSVIYLVRRDVERRAALWMVLFVVAACLSAVPLMIGFAGAYRIWPGLTFLPTQTALLFGPAILLHSQMLMLKNPSPRCLWLLTPGLVYLLYQVWAFAFLGDYKAKWAFNDAWHEPYIFPTAMIGAWALMAVCFGLIWRLRGRYMQWLEDNHSDGDRFNPVWLSHSIILASIAGILWALEVIFEQWVGHSYGDVFLWNVSALLAVFIITLEALTGITQPFPKMGDEAEREAAEPKEPGSRDWVLEGTRLKAAVLENNWHLDAGLTLHVLARRFGMNQLYLSRAINQGLGENFSTFINGLRIEHAKRLIREADGGRSIMDIALASGFGSKASFNRAFRHHTGSSPTAFRDENART
ncbi:MAG: helix-turn-helix domain-containing protein [Pseudomonadota bacterium]